MKRFIGVKIVKAKEMTRGQYNIYRGWAIPADEDPSDDGYFVVYPDGYESWCPKQQFEEANRLTSGMTFGLAVESAKKGCKIARAGWNGKGMFVTYVGIGHYDVGVDTVGAIKGFQPWLGMKTAAGLFVPWLASQADMLEEDWCIVDDCQLVDS